MLPDQVQKVMESLSCSLESRLPSKIESIYIYGSIALGDYIVGSSDIDFIAIIRTELTSSEILAIAEAHNEVEMKLPETDIMGSYIRREDLGEAVRPGQQLITYYNKQLHTNGKGADLNPITWWILRNHGIRAYGATISFTYESPLDFLLRYVIANMNSYWAGYVERLELQLQTAAASNAETSISTEQADEAVEWCVLGMLRQLYTIREHGVTSKIEAGKYGIQVLSDRWHGLINEAITIKQLQPQRFYYSQQQRLSDLVELLRWIHSETNQAYKAYTELK